jgi:hypothetical protein
MYLPLTCCQGWLCYVLPKVNDSKDANFSSLVDALARELETSKKEIFANEFSVYTALEFSLFLPIWEIGPHLNNIERYYIFTHIRLLPTFTT